MVMQRANAVLSNLGGFATRPWNVVANLASVIGLIVTLLAILKWDYTWILAGYLCGMSLFLLVRYVRQERWSRYAEANVVMERGLRRLKEVSDRAMFRESSDDEFIDGLGNVLSALAEAFTLVTGTNCRATLKEVYYEAVISGRGSEQIQETNELVAASMARSDPDRNRTVRQEKGDRVTDNSDFDSVIASSTPFFNNDLPGLWMAGEYRNSHWDDSLRTSREFPYRSAIVWPIEADRPGAGPSEDADATRDRVIGLLCIDSKRSGAFRKATDIPMGALFAHALYPVLRYQVGE